MSTKTVEKKDSYYRDVLRKFTAHKLAMIGVAVILLEVILVIVLPMIMKLDPYTSDILAFSAKPGAGHILGTDDTGRICTTGLRRPDLPSGGTAFRDHQSLHRCTAGSDRRLL